MLNQQQTADYVTISLSQREVTTILDALGRMPLAQTYGVFSKLLQADQLARSVQQSALQEPEDAK